MRKGTDMRKKLQNMLFEFCYILEIAISCVIGIAAVILCIRLFWEMINSTVFGSGDDVLVNVLDGAMTLAIGVELIKMLCKHTSETIVEVLMFAIAKQLVVQHTTPLENLITVATIAGLFAIRKFLFRKEDKISGKGWRRKNKKAIHEGENENENVSGI